jgi:hypothetical protein
MQAEHIKRLETLEGKVVALEKITMDLLSLVSTLTLIVEKQQTHLETFKLK